MTEVGSPDMPSNWGRWGAEDERGTLNFIDPRVTMGAARAVRSGRVYSLGLPVQREGMPHYDFRGAPHRLTLTGPSDAEMFGAYGAPEGDGASEEMLVIASHNGTHMDALSHIYSRQLMYNGFKTDIIKTNSGSPRLGIEKTGGFATRMVLLDIAAHQEVSCLGPGTPIGADDLESCRAAQGVEVHPGDALLLVRTGWLESYTGQVDGEPPSMYEQPGLGLAAVAFVRDHQVAAVGVDNSAVEVLPFDQGRFQPLHVELIVKLGVTLFEHLDLSALARDKEYEGLFVVGPLLITGAAGSPVNPIVIV